MSLVKLQSILLHKKKMVNMKYIKIFGLIWVIFALFGCSDSGNSDKDLYTTESPPKSTKKKYTLAIHPLYNPQKLNIAYGPLVDYINKQLNEDNVEIQIEASTNYQVYEGKIKSKQPDILLPNPWQTLIAMDNGYSVVAMAGSPNDFKGLFLVRKDSGIHSIKDLVGKKISYPSYTALAAAIMPQYYMFKNGINPNKDVYNYYVGSQESSIENMYLKKVDVGVTWPPPWRMYQKDHPMASQDIEVLAETEYLINNSVMVKDTLPEGVKDKILKILISLSNDDASKYILDAAETDKFIISNNDEYNKIREYISLFERDVRPVDIEKMTELERERHIVKAKTK